jgi:bifunctional UDP-N-acetylglucosamine pyrophosphorylase/glucosamine-1-phosphate N-acetyltransferase
MTTRPLAAVVMAAGLGTRMKSARPKHLHELLGRRLIDWVVGAAAPLDVAPLVVVCAPETRAALEGTMPTGVELAVQERPLGTGDAVASARPALEGFEGDLLVLAGDTPLLRAAVLEDLVGAHRRDEAAVTVLSFEPPDPRAYGRVVRDAEGSLSRIVEAADASATELAITEVNSSIYVFRVPELWEALGRIDAANAQGELYLTDAVRVLVSDPRGGAVHLAPDHDDVEGVNTRVELAAAAGVLRERILHEHMLEGVTVVDPATTWIEPTVTIEADSVIEPFTSLRGHTVVRRGAVVGPHAVVVDAEVGTDALVGPFCYLRPGTVLEDGSKAGTFVEIKNSRIGRGAKVPHQTYLGDADVGEDSNIAAGNITANFPHQPGQPKGRTTIGRNVRTGVHNSFIAPVTVGDEAWVGAGSTITEDVPAHSLAIARARQVNKERRDQERRDGAEHD